MCWKFELGTSQLEAVDYLPRFTYNFVEQPQAHENLAVVNKNSYVCFRAFYFQARSECICCSSLEISSGTCNDPKFSSHRRHVFGIEVLNIDR